MHRFTMYCLQRRQEFLIDVACKGEFIRHLHVLHGMAGAIDAKAWQTDAPRARDRTELAHVLSPGRRPREGGGQFWRPAWEKGMESPCAANLADHAATLFLHSAAAMVVSWALYRVEAAITVKPDPFRPHCLGLNAMVIPNPLGHSAQ